MIGWDQATALLAAGSASLVSLWAEPGAVHVAVLQGDAIHHARLDCPDGHYPSLAATHPPALRLERALRDLYGLQPDGLPDPRPG